MRILVIDSHKGSEGEVPQNLHWKNAKAIVDSLADDLQPAVLIWSYPSVNDNIREGFDKIVFVHASAYSYVDKAWLEGSPNAELFYVTNEYNLGEPTILWKQAKAGRHYTVIANHPPEPSKIVKKYTKDWIQVNLNSLSFNPVPPVLGTWKSKNCIYYGSFRKGREASFRKYLQGDVIISTHSKNRDKFLSAGVKGQFVDRVNWKKLGLSMFESSLYIEDDVTHTHYNYLANRFYEALNYGIPTVFTKECQATIDKSGYLIPEYQIIDSPKIPRLGVGIPMAWMDKAAAERKESIDTIKRVILS